LNSREEISYIWIEKISFVSVMRFSAFSAAQSHYGPFCEGKAVFRKILIDFS